MTTLSEQTSNLYTLYEQSIVKLAQSMVIKFDLVAQATNNLVLTKTGTLIDSSDRTQWKYYQNICGQYNFSDTAMYVYSLDSETTIPFTVAALASNPVTAAAYQYGSALYNELVATYPDQELLILGILYPANMAEAIAADDGTILLYPTYLVESQEIDLIYNLQQWLYAYVNRWVINAFSLTDELYPAMVLIQANLNLIPVIFNLRLRMCKTNQAHSFHVKQYLRSHGFIDVYLNQMTSKQALRLYRNIDYYVRNAGYTSTFDDLVDILFTQAGMPVYKYVAYQKTEAISRANIADSANMLPTAIFRREPVNSIAKNYPAPDYNLTQVFEVLSSTAPGTVTYQNNNAAEIEKKFDISQTSRLITKVVEVGINPVAAPVQTIPDLILYNQWISLVCTNKYAVPVEYTPVGLTEPVRMTHQQALAMWIYATSKAMQPQTPPQNYVALTRVPMIRAQRVAIDPVPTLNSLLGMVDQTVTSAASVAVIHNSAVATPSTVASLIEFTAFCNSLYQASSAQYIEYSIQENPIARAQLQQVTESLYEDVTFVLAEMVDPADSTKGMLYVDLMQKIGINLSNYSPEDYYSMATAIYNYATGATSTSFLDPANIQASMVALMEYLSSYSLTFVKSGEVDTVMTVGHPMVRMYGLTMAESEIQNVDEVYCDALDGTFQESIDISATLDAAIIENSFSIGQAISINDQLVDFSANSTYVQIPRVEQNIDIGLWYTTTDLDPDVLFAQLTPAQKQSVVDGYRIN